MQTIGDGANMARLNRIAFVQEAMGDLANAALVGSVRVVSDALSFSGGFGATVAGHQPILLRSCHIAAPDRPEFSQANAALSDPKARIFGTYHHFKFAKYADPYLAETRHWLIRYVNLTPILLRPLRAAVPTGPRPEAMIGLAEFWN